MKLFAITLTLLATSTAGSKVPRRLTEACRRLQEARRLAEATAPIFPSGKVEAPDDLDAELDSLIEHWTAAEKLDFQTDLAEAVPSDESESQGYAASWNCPGYSNPAPAPPSGGGSSGGGSSGGGSSGGGGHNHNPHGHSPHGHSPHGHSPHVHTPYPTPSPTSYPTPSPTNHICLTNAHNCDTTEAGICYRPSASDYTRATTDHDEGVNGVDDHQLDANVWIIPEGTKLVKHSQDSTRDRHHAYKCGCREGYNCVAGCSPPFAGHTCEMTKYPTPYPTSNPTPAPTPWCPVTCETDKGQFDGMTVYGHAKGAFGKQGFYRNTLAELGGCDAKGNIHGNPFSKGKTVDPRFGGIHKKCDWHNRRAHRIVATHNTEQINEHDSLRKHRCYTYKGKCLCECLDNVDGYSNDASNSFKADINYQDGTVQGEAAGLDGTHRGGNKDQYEETKESMRKAGTQWKAPNYINQKDDTHDETNHDHFLLHQEAH